MPYKYYTKTNYSTVCHILEFDPKEFRLDISLGIVGKLETLPKIAGEPKDNEKVIAKMNASFFTMSGKEGDTYSTFVDDGIFYTPPCPGYPTLILWKDYKMTFEKDPTQARIADYQKDAFFAIGVGWTLLIDGKANTTYEKKKLVEMFGHPYSRAPRSMIGQKADGTVVFVVTNGRGTGSLGLTTDHMIDIMQKLECVTAACMDGGGSSELYLDGKTINKLQNNYHRPIGTAFVVYGPKENTQVAIKPEDIKYSPHKTGVIINAVTVNLRSGAGTNFSAIGSVKNGDKITITGTNTTGKWYKIKDATYGSAWISATYISLVTAPASTAKSTATTSPATQKTTTPPAAPTTKTGVINAKSGLYAKTDPTSSGKKCGAFNYGAKVTIHGEKSGFYNVSGTEGWGTLKNVWVSKQYVTVK